jgi:hypothetical protein
MIHALDVEFPGKCWISTSNQVLTASCYSVTSLYFPINRLIGAMKSELLKASLCEPKAKNCEHNQIWSQTGSNITDLSTVFEKKKIADITLLSHNILLTVH